MTIEEFIEPFKEILKKDQTLTKDEKIELAANLARNWFVIMSKRGYDTEFLFAARQLERND